MLSFFAIYHSISVLMEHLKCVIILTAQICIAEERDKMSSDVIRVRAALAVIHEGNILLVPHYNTDVAPLQWYIPGGKAEFGETLREAAMREFDEETGMQAQAGPLLDVSEIIRPEKPWHSITVTFLGDLTGGTLRAEMLDHFVQYGDKTPRWFSWPDLQSVNYHPATAVEAAFKHGGNS
jgi:8-oxo-dGTP diphosphatase